MRLPANKNIKPSRFYNANAMAQRFQPRIIYTFHRAIKTESILSTASLFRFSLSLYQHCMKKIHTILSLLFFLCTHICGQTANPQKAINDTGGAEFTFITKRIYDFGAVVKNASASCQFQFTNTGNHPLTITEMHSSPREINSPDYTLQISYPRKPIKPGKKGIITVSFKAQDEIGSFRNELYVTSNATVDNYPLLLVAGAVVPEPNPHDPPYNPESTILGAAVGAFMINNIKK